MVGDPGLGERQAPWGERPGRTGWPRDSGPGGRRPGSGLLDCARPSPPRKQNDELVFVCLFVFIRKSWAVVVVPQRFAYSHASSVPGDLPAAGRRLISWRH